MATKLEYVSVDRLRGIREKLTVVLTEIDAALGQVDLAIPLPHNYPAASPTTLSVHSSKHAHSSGGTWGVPSQMELFTVGTGPKDRSYADLVWDLVPMQRFQLREAANIVLPRVKNPAKRALDIMRQSLYRDKRFIHETDNEGRVWFTRSLEHM